MPDERIISPYVRNLEDVQLSEYDTCVGGSQINRIKVKHLMTFIVFISFILCYSAWVIRIVSNMKQNDAIPNVNRLQKIGDAIIIRLKKYKTDNGNYPDSLAEAEIYDTTTEFGGFIYYCSKDKKYIRLYIGNSNKYNFYLYWDNNNDSWNLDI